MRRCESTTMVECEEPGAYKVFEPIRCERQDGHEGEHRRLITWNDGQQDELI